MKLRYYMRGLGIGIFVTAILMALTIHGKTERLTDEQIIERAEALGMEMKYSSDVLADTVSENAAEDTKPAELPNQVKEETSLANRLAAEEKTENPQKKHFKQSKGHLLLMRPVKRRLFRKADGRASYPVRGRTKSDI